MNKDPIKITNALSFLTKVFEKYEDREPSLSRKNDKILRIRETFCDMFGCAADRNVFYLLPCKEFGGESLLWYINSKGVRLLRQREELIDLSVKIANLNKRRDTMEAMDQVIDNFKSGLASGVGLRDDIIMIKERYPWTSLKRVMMILVSLLACLLAIGLYVLDVVTDIQFTLEIFNMTNEICSPHRPNYSLVLKSISYSFPEKCKSTIQETMENCWDENRDDFKPENNTEYIADMKITGWVAVFHCVKPLVVNFFVFLNINYKEKKCLPAMPILIHIYMFYLNVRFANARRNSASGEKIESIERAIQKYTAQGNIWKYQTISFISFSFFFLPQNLCFHV